MRRSPLRRSTPRLAGGVDVRRRTGLRRDYPLVEAYIVALDFECGKDAQDPQGLSFACWQVRNRLLVGCQHRARTPFCCWCGCEPRFRTRFTLLNVTSSVHFPLLPLIAPSFP